MVILGALSIVFMVLSLLTFYNVGDFIVTKCQINLNKWLKMLFGGLTIAGIFQIIYYPLEWFQLSSQLLYFLGLGLIGILFCFDIYKWKNIKEVFFNKTIWIILGFAALIFFFYMRTLPHAYWFFDDSFYLPYMYENAHTTNLLSIEARSGFSLTVPNNLYSFQGYYFIGSFLIILFENLGSLFHFSFHYLSVIHYFMSMPTLVLLLIGIYGLGNQITKTKKEKYLFYGLSCFYTIFLPFSANILNNVYMNSYIGIFALASLFVPMIIFFLFEYMKGKREYKVPIVFSFFGMLAYASFSMFLICIIFYAMAFYFYHKKKQIYVEDFVLMSIPLFIYIMSFLFLSHKTLLCLGILLLVILYGVYFYFQKRMKKINEILEKFIHFILIGFPIIACLGSFLLCMLRMNVVSVSTFFNQVISNFFPIYGNVEFYYFFIPITLFYMFVVFTYFYLYKKNKVIKMDHIWILTILLVFLNPLTIAFVATCLTSSVYERIFILFFNPFIFFLLFREFIKDFRYQKLVNVGIVCLLVVPPLLLLKDFHYWVGVMGKSDKEVRLSEREINGSKIIQEYMEKYQLERPLLATKTMNEFRVYNPNIEMLYTRLYELIPDDDTTKKDYQIETLYRFLNGHVLNKDIISYGTIPEILRENNISFLIIDNDGLEKSLLEPLYEEQYQLVVNKYEKIYETRTYTLYFTGKEK